MLLAVLIFHLYIELFLTTKRDFYFKTFLLTIKSLTAFYLGFNDSFLSPNAVFFKFYYKCKN